MNKGHDAPHPPIEGITYGSVWIDRFGASAPTLTTADGAVYVPIRWLCDLLGLSPAHWIGAVCALYHPLSPSVREPEPSEPLRRLPTSPSSSTSVRVHSVHTSRLEWCLEWRRVVRWLLFDLNIRRVPEDVRRAQIQAFRKETYAAAIANYERTQGDFEATKRDLVAQVQTTERTMASLRRVQTSVLRHLTHGATSPADVEAHRAALETLMAEGLRRHGAVAGAVRSALAELNALAVEEVVRVEQGQVTIGSGGVLPFAALTSLLQEIERAVAAAAAWQNRDLIDWLVARGFVFSDT